ncbi:hypothetical protein [Acidovorax sp. 106]|uniref:hypothetical protein n=1 Tax=Acidovorax sp. 106 TaxID=2135637 RepID=UPI001F304389|nr:hypothetical protein [Acidovorax sp. 106]
MGLLHDCATPSDRYGQRMGTGKHARVVALAAAADLMPDGFQPQLCVNEERAHITVAVNRLSASGGLAMTPISWYKVIQK